MSGATVAQERLVRVERARRAGRAPRRYERFPLEPLLGFLRAAGVDVLERRGDGWPMDRGWHSAAAEAIGVTARTMARWGTHGLAPWQADSVACALGLHPVLVWPEWAA